jgi:hypothetical protein
MTQLLDTRNGFEKALTECEARAKAAEDLEQAQLEVQDAQGKDATIQAQAAEKQRMVGLTVAGKEEEVQRANIAIMETVEMHSESKDYDYEIPQSPEPVHKGKKGTSKKKKAFKVATPIKFDLTEAKKENETTWRTCKDLL